jgi:hypothetical protein
MTYSESESDPKITADSFLVDLATLVPSTDAHPAGESSIVDSRAFARPLGDDRPPLPPEPRSTAGSTGRPGSASLNPFLPPTLRTPEPTEA